MQQAIERYALPYFVSLSTVEKMLHELRGPNAEHLCRWNPEIRSIIAACTDALLGNQDSARSLLRASSAGTRDKNLKSYIEKLDERIAAWPAASSG